MRILQVLHFFLPRHSAGTEVYTDGLAQALAVRGHDVHLFFTEKILSAENYTLRRREHAGLPCHVLVNNLLYEGFRETFENPAVERRFETVLDEVRPDVVHFQHLMLLSLRLPAVVARRGIRSVMTLHDFWLHCARFGQLMEHGDVPCEGPEPAKCASCLDDFKYSQSPLEKRVISAIRWTRETAGFDLAPVVDAWRRSKLAEASRLLPRRRRAPAREAAADLALTAEFAVRRRVVADLAPHVDLFLSPSRTVRDRTVAFGLPARKVEVLPLGIRPLVVPPRAPLAGRAPVFGFIGTLAPHKGVHVLIEAMRHLEGRGELVVHGRSDYYPRYVASLRAAAHGLPVRFAGAVARADIGAAFAAIDVLVMPSVWLENYPIIIQEARAAGVPVVASDLGGMQEAIRHDVDGLLFEAGNARALADRLLLLLAEPARVGRLAAALTPPITLDEHVDQVEARLAALVTARREDA